MPGTKTETGPLGSQVPGSLEEIPPVPQAPEDQEELSAIEQNLKEPGPQVQQPEVPEPPGEKPGFMQAIENIEEKVGDALGEVGEKIGGMFGHKKEE